MIAVRMSWHAEQRRAEVGFTMEQVEAVVRDPDLAYPGDARHGGGRTIHQRDGIAAVLAPDGLVITLMPSGRATDAGSTDPYRQTPGAGHRKRLWPRQREIRPQVVVGL